MKSVVNTSLVKVLSISLIGGCAVAHAHPINLLRPQLIRAAKIALVTTAGATTASSWAGYYQGYQTVAKKNDGIYREFDRYCVDRSLRKAFVILAPVYAFKKLANPLVKLFKESYEIGYQDAQLEKVRRGEYDKIRVNGELYHTRFCVDDCGIRIASSLKWIKS